MTRVWVRALLDFEQLSLIETLCIGAHAIERSAPTGNDSVLVIGSGPIGLAAIQSVLATGATVTVLDMNESRLDFVREQIGVKRTLKPAGVDTAEAIANLNDGRMPSVIIDATGPSILTSINAGFPLSKARRNAGPRSLGSSTFSPDTPIPWEMAEMFKGLSKFMPTYSLSRSLSSSIRCR